MASCYCHHSSDQSEASIVLLLLQTSWTSQSVSVALCGRWDPLGAQETGIVKLRFKSRSGDGQVKVKWRSTRWWSDDDKVKIRKVKVRLGPAQRTQKLRGLSYDQKSFLVNLNLTLTQVEHVIQSDHHHPVTWHVIIIGHHQHYLMSGPGVRQPDLVTNRPLLLGSWQYWQAWVQTPNPSPKPRPGVKSKTLPNHPL